MMAGQALSGGLPTALRAAMWGGSALLLALPAAAMQFTGEVDWSLVDFLVMGTMLALACSGFELAARASDRPAFLAASAVAIATAFLVTWINLAVGLIGNEHNPVNQLFWIVLAVALAGALVARFRPAGMARAMQAAALAHAAVVAFGFAVDGRKAAFAALFALGWLLSAFLFRRAARTP